MLASDSARDSLRSGSDPATIGNVDGSTQILALARKMIAMTPEFVVHY